MLFMPFSFPPLFLSLSLTVPLPPVLTRTHPLFYTWTTLVLRDFKKKPIPNPSHRREEPASLTHRDILAFYRREEQPRSQMAATEMFKRQATPLFLHVRISRSSWIRSLPLRHHLPQGLGLNAVTSLGHDNPIPGMETFCLVNAFAERDGSRIVAVLFIYFQVAQSKWNIASRLYSMNQWISDTLLSSGKKKKERFPPCSATALLG